MDFSEYGGDQSYGTGPLESLLRRGFTVIFSRYQDTDLVEMRVVNGLADYTQIVRNDVDECLAAAVEEVEARGEW